MDLLLWYGRITAPICLAISLYTLIFVVPNSATYKPGMFNPTNELLLGGVMVFIAIISVAGTVFSWKEGSKEDSNDENGAVTP